MLGFLERLLSRAPKGASREKKIPPASQPRDDARSPADQDRDNFEAESERLRASDRIVGPGG